jgi:hypothetical protein
MDIGDETPLLLQYKNIAESARSQHSMALRSARRQFGFFVDLTNRKVRYVSRRSSGVQSGRCSSKPWDTGNRNACETIFESTIVPFALYE